MAHLRAQLACVMVVAGLPIVIAACGGSSGRAVSSQTAAASKSNTVTTQPTPPTTGVAIPADCHTWGCRAQASVNLADDMSIRLWLSPDTQNYRSRPVVELLNKNAATQWWISPEGDGWNGSLKCETTGAEPNCIVTDSLGMHSSLAEMLILRDGRLVHPNSAQVITNSAGIRAADLNHDGYLDVIGSTNDYKPNFAQGHNYWQTFRYASDRFISTGCVPAPPHTPPPTHLVSGRCPNP